MLFFLNFMRFTKKSRKKICIMLTNALYLLKLNKNNCSTNLTIFFQTNTNAMRLNQKHVIIFLLNLILTNYTIAQESVKLTFFKSGVVEYRQTEPFGAKMPEQSLIALMVYVKNANPTNCKSLGVNLSNKIVLVESMDCGIVQTAQAAQEAGAAAVIVIDRKGEKVAIKTPLLKIPCLRVEEGTGTFYAQKSEKPVLVCLSGSMYDGKVISNETPKVQDISLDERTRLALQIPMTSSGSLSSVRSEESAIRRIEIPDLNDTTDTENTTAQPAARVAAIAPPSVTTPDMSDFTAKGKTAAPTPPPTVAPQQTLTQTPPPATIPKIVENAQVQEGSTDFRAQFEVYPRRVSEFLAISYNLEKRSNLKITLFDAAGKPIIEKNIENALADFMELEVLKLASGSYKLLIINDVAKASYNIDIQH